MKSNPPLAAAAGRTLLDRFRDEGLAAELLAEMDRQERQRRSRRRARARGGLAAAAAVLVVALAVWLVPLVRDTDEVRTLAGQRQAHALADGSHVELNARTDLHTDFRYGRRRVQLTQGEAYFAVASDPARPFVIETPAGQVRVTGTKFNVRLAPDGRVEVTLVEGGVTIDGLAGESVSLVPAQHAEIESGRAEVRETTPDEIDRLLAWREGRLVLDGLPLAEATARFAAFHGIVIHVDPRAAGVRLGGAHALSELDRFLRALEATGAVQVVARGDGSYRVVSR